MMDVFRGRRRLSLLVGLAALALLAGMVPAAAAARQPTTRARPAAPASSGARCDVNVLRPALHLAQVTVNSAAMNTTGSFTSPGQPTLTGLPAFCDVALTQTDAAGNPIHIEAWLPATWNGRFQGVGGAVYECGPLFGEMGPAIQGGYAAATTDCGVPPADALTGAWALRADGTLNMPLIDDFAFAGIHDMSVAGQALTRIYYPSPLRFSYFNGCSTGGREGLMEAQRYPADYNGISAGAPERIWQGPQTTQGQPLWFGLERGASLAGLAATTTSSGVTTGNAFPVAVAWLGTWLQKNPSWDWHTLTFAQFDTLFQQSVSEFADVIATDNPNLSAFRHDGGKILIWHGLADQLIFPQGTVDYYQRVQRAMGGPAATDAFARLFLASGAQHCASAAGPAPAPGAALNAVVSWVEHGTAPSSILGTTTDPATGVVTDSRPICLYPAFARYTGSGSTTQASSFVCAG